MLDIDFLTNLLNKLWKNYHDQLDVQ